MLHTQKWLMSSKGLVSIMMGVVLLLSGCGGEQAKAPAEEISQETELQSNGEEQSKLAPEELPKHLMEGKYKVVYAQMSSELQSIVTLEQFKAMSEDFNQGVTSWKESANFSLNDAQMMNWVDNRGEKGVFAAFDDVSTIIGIQLIPLEKHSESDQKLTSYSYGLPFRGDWLVYWGGEDVMNNYHYAVESQRYAIDLIQVKEGFSYQGDAARNESYYAFGQEIIAAGDGTVVAIENGVADNDPVGTMNEKQPLGNYVIVEHGNGEFSYYAHLQKGSVKVEVGDSVTKGQLIGNCGNSGNSSEAHLHFQVSDGPELFESKAINVRWDEEASLIRGAIVSGQ